MIVSFKGEKNWEFCYATFLYTLFVETFYACTTTVKKLTPRDTFFRNKEPNRVPETNLSYLQNIPIYFPSRKNRFSIHSFLELVLLQSFWCTIFRVPQKAF